MRDFLRKRADDQRINANQDHEFRYWSVQLKVSEETLRLAMGHVGPMVADVRRWIYLHT
jgi:Protein of unknown function (DUF3606)